MSRVAIVTLECIGYVDVNNTAIKYDKIMLQRDKNKNTNTTTAPQNIA